MKCRLCHKGKNTKINTEPWVNIQEHSHRFLHLDYWTLIKQMRLYDPSDLTAALTSQSENK